VPNKAGYLKFSIIPQTKNPANVGLDIPNLVEKVKFLFSDN